MEPPTKKQATGTGTAAAAALTNADLLAEVSRRKLSVPAGAGPVPRLQLPPPSHCPAGGVHTFACTPPSTTTDVWIFLWNHFADLDYFNEHVFEGAARVTGVTGASKPCIAYPARLRGTAGFRREWGHRGGVGAEAIGDQTVTRLFRGSVDEPPHEMVGVLVCLQGAKMDAVDTVQDHWLRDRMQPGARTSKTMKAHVEDVDSAHFDWLAPMDNKSLGPGSTVRVMYFNTAACAPGGHGGPALPGAEEAEGKIHSVDPKFAS
jgi:hypothetical protein